MLSSRPRAKGAPHWHFAGFAPVPAWRGGDLWSVLRLSGECASLAPSQRREPLEHGPRHPDGIVAVGDRRRPPPVAASSLRPFLLCVGPRAAKIRRGGPSDRPCATCANGPAAAPRSPLGAHPTMPIRSTSPSWDARRVRPTPCGRQGPEGSRPTTATVDGANACVARQEGNHPGRKSAAPDPPCGPRMRRGAPWAGLPREAVTLTGLPPT